MGDGVGAAPQQHTRSPMCGCGPHWDKLGGVGAFGHRMFGHRCPSGGAAVGLVILCAPAVARRRVLDTLVGGGCLIEATFENLYAK